jgi:hypothetical protein
MKAFGEARLKPGPFRSVLAVALLLVHPAVTVAAETVKITTGDWRIHKPSKAYRDLPALLPKAQDSFNAGIGLVEFVCRTSSYYMLLVQPSRQWRDAEPGAVALRAANAPPGQPIALTFRNLYKTRTPLSRSLNWDADIFYAEVSAAWLTSLTTASDLDLTLAGQDYAVALADLGARVGSFRRFCEKGVVDDPAHVDAP